jgi:hypothetical protein
MDLSTTPLQSTIVLDDTDPPSEVTDNLYNDPPSNIPLPESPQSQSPLELDSPTSLTSPPLHVQPSQEHVAEESDLQRIERELVTARRNVEERGRVLNDLRGVVEDLKLRLEGGTGSTIGN